MAFNTKQLATLQQNENGLFLVFSSEEEAEEFIENYNIRYQYFACFNGYMNALCLRDDKNIVS